MPSRYEQLLELARQGTPEDQKNFAYYCLQNEQGALRPIMAHEWFRRAAESGDAEAQYMLGLLYTRKDMGWRINTEKSSKWFMLAADNGFEQARTALEDLSAGREPDLPACAPIQWPTVNQSIPSFRDIAFKKDANGEYVVNVIDDGAPLSSEDDFQHYRDDQISKYDESRLFETLQLAVHEPDPARDPFADLDSLIGLEPVKSQIDFMAKRMEFDLRRREVGFSNDLPCDHMMFMGNPGTGKTEVARILGHIFLKTGRLSRGHVVEVDRAELVGAWVGWSALKVKHVLKKAQGGVLLIDEAYALQEGYSNDYGDEVLSTLLKAMEDQRRDLIVILTGYPAEMKTLLLSNPGFKSRVRHLLEFSDFNAEEMTEIFERQCRLENFMLHPDARPILSRLMREAEKFEDKKHFGNARFVRNVFEKSLEKMALRVIQNNLIARKDLQTIVFSDMPDLEELTGKKRKASKTGTGTIIPL